MTKILLLLISCFVFHASNTLHPIVHLSTQGVEKNVIYIFDKNGIVTKEQNYQDKAILKDVYQSHTDNIDGVIKNISLHIASIYTQSEKTQNEIKALYEGDKNVYVDKVIQNQNKPEQGHNDYFSYISLRLKNGTYQRLFIAHDKCKEFEIKISKDNISIYFVSKNLKKMQFTKDYNIYNISKDMQNMDLKFLDEFYANTYNENNELFLMSDMQNEKINVFIQAKKSFFSKYTFIFKVMLGFSFLFAATGLTVCLIEGNKEQSTILKLNESIEKKEESINSEKEVQKEADKITEQLKEIMDDTNYNKAVADLEGKIADLKSEHQAKESEKAGLQSAHQDQIDQAKETLESMIPKYDEMTTSVSDLKDAQNTFSNLQDTKSGYDEDISEKNISILQTEIENKELCNRMAEMVYCACEVQRGLGRACTGECVYYSIGNISEKNKAVCEGYDNLC